MDLAADGSLWRVTSPAGIRYVRARAGGIPHPVEDGATAVPATAPCADEFARQAPARLAELRALAEAQAPRYGWSLLRVGTPDAAPAGWVLQVDSPDGGRQMYAWERGSGGMRPLCSAELLPAVTLAGPAGGPP